MSNPPNDDKQDDDFDLDLDLGDLDLDLEEPVEPASSDGGCRPDGTAAGASDPGAYEPPASHDSAPVPPSSATPASHELPERVEEVDPTGAPGATPARPDVADGNFGDATGAGVAPAAGAVVTDAGRAAVGEDAEVPGQWVWQFAAPPPPPSFSAVFFAGTALKELYRFFSCGVLVALGALLPWRADVAGVEGTVPGLTLPMGAVTLALSLWLVWASCAAIYSRKQKILPVFLMLVPFEISLMRLLGAWDAVDASLPPLEQLNSVLYRMGSGVLLVFVGSAIVSVQFVLTVLKIFGKKGGKGERSARDRKGGADPDGSGQAKAARPTKREKPAKPDKADKRNKKAAKADKGGRGADEAAGDAPAAEAGDGGRGIKGKRRGRRR